MSFIWLFLVGGPSCTHCSSRISNRDLKVEPTRWKVTARGVSTLNRRDKGERHIPVILGITALPSRTVSRKYCPLIPLPGVRPYSAVKVSFVAWKEEDFVVSKLPGGHVGEQPEESGAGSQKSALPVSISRVAGCGGFPTLTLTVYFYRIGQQSKGIFTCTYLMEYIVVHGKLKGPLCKRALFHGCLGKIQFQELGRTEDRARTDGPEQNRKHSVGLTIGDVCAFSLIDSLNCLKGNGYKHLLLARRMTRKGATNTAET